MMGSRRVQSDLQPILGSHTHALTHTHSLKPSGRWRRDSPKVKWFLKELLAEKERRDKEKEGIKRERREKRCITDIIRGFCKVNGSPRKNCTERRTQAAAVNGAAAR